MSKSEAALTRDHAVRLTDDPDTIRAVIRRAVTDTGREIRFSEAPEKAGINNLLEIYELFSGQGRGAIEAHFAGQGYAALKREVSAVVVEGLRPIREQYEQLIADPGELDRVLADGAERARAVAEPKLAQVKCAVGYLAPEER
jgi:tryptophanyl-tRNA synthetase